MVVDRHAGWLLGADMVLAPNEHLAARPVRMFLPSGRGRLRSGLADSGERAMRPDDVTEVHGIPVTTPLRTAWDLGMVRWPDEAVSGIDRICALRRFTKQELLGGLPRFRGRRWVTTLRAIAPLADPRSESPPESVLRLRCHEAGMPEMVPQVEVWEDGVLLARLDLADEEHRVAVEYDGVEWHSTPEQLAHDRWRRLMLTEEFGWTIETFTAYDVFGRPRDCFPKLYRLKRQLGL